MSEPSDPTETTEETDADGGAGSSESDDTPIEAPKAADGSTEAAEAPTDAPEAEPDAIEEAIEDAGRALSGAVDSILGEIGDFLVDLTRTWGVIAFRPWSAVDRLLNDNRAEGGRYITPSAFLVVAAMTSALMTQGGGDKPVSLHMAVETLMNAAGGEADAAWFFAAALISGAVIFGFVRAASWTLPEDRREEGHRVAMWCLAATAASTGPFAVTMALTEGNDYLWLSGFWWFWMAPSIALTRWVWTSGLSLRPLRLLLAPVFVLLFIAAWRSAEDTLDAQEADFTWEDQSVWFGAKESRELENGTTVVTARMFSTAKEPWEHCDYRFCDPETWENPQCHSTTLLSDHVPWLVPGEPVYLEFEIGTEWYVPGGTQMCCWKKDGEKEWTSCLRGQRQDVHERPLWVPAPAIDESPPGRSPE